MFLFFNLTLCTAVFLILFHFLFCENLMKSILWHMAFCTLMLLPNEGGSLEISRKGAIVYLSGPVVSNDQFDFKEFMTDPQQAGVQIIKLNSTGGKTLSAIHMGRLIRSLKLTTWVDAKTDNCASACTILFASGVNRHYTNAAFIKDGVYEKKSLKVGLGYHEAHVPQSLHANHYSGAATAEEIRAFYEFGSPNAARLVPLAPPDKLYKLSAQTALQLEIATSLLAP